MKMEISICPRAKTAEQMNTAVFGWERFAVGSFKAIESVAKAMPYSSSYFRKYEDLPTKIGDDGKIRKVSQRQKSQVVGVAPISIFDIDSGFSIKETINLLEKKEINYMILTTKSHGTPKANGEDRFRVFIPLVWSRNEVYGTSGIPLTDDANKRALNELELKFLQIEIARELGIEKYVDPSPLSDLARKYMPSPIDAISIIQDKKNDFDIDIVRQSAYDLTIQEKEKQAERRKLATQIKEKLNSYEELKKINHKSYIDMGVLCSVDLANVMVKYISEEGSYVSVKQEQSYFYVLDGAHKYSIIFDTGKGEYISHDFKSSISGNILTFMKEKFPNLTFFQRALKIQNDFKGELDGAKIIKDNPAFYIERLKSQIEKEEYGDLGSVLERCAKEIEISKMSINKNGTLECTQKNGFIVNIAIPKEQKGEIASLLKEMNDRAKKNSLKDLPEETGYPKP